VELHSLVADEAVGEETGAIPGSQINAGSSTHWSAQFHAETSRLLPSSNSSHICITRAFKSAVIFE
jgi:hypothetical protein